MLAFCSQTVKSVGNKYEILQLCYQTREVFSDKHKRDMVLSMHKNIATLLEPLCLKLKQQKRENIFEKHPKNRITIQCFFIYKLLGVFQTLFILFHVFKIFPDSKTLENFLAHRELLAPGSNTFMYSNPKGDCTWCLSENAEKLGLKPSLQTDSKM